MKTFLKYSVGCLTAVSLMSSCGSDTTPEMITSSSFQSSNLITGISTPGETVYTIYASPSIDYTLDYYNNTIVLTFRQLPVTDKTSISLKTEPIKINNSPYEISASAQSVATTSTDVVLKGFNINWLLSSTLSCISIRFNYDDREYCINSSATYHNSDNTEKGIIYSGETDITNSSYAPTGYKSNEIQYIVTYNIENSTATMCIPAAKFAENMPNLYMKFHNIPFTMTSNGYILESSEDIVPTTGFDETPQPNFLISDFMAQLPFDGSNGYISFKSPRGDVDVTQVKISSMNNTTKDNWYNNN